MENIKLKIKTLEKYTQNEKQNKSRKNFKWMEWTDNKKKWFVLKVFFIQSGAWALDKSFTRPSFFLYFWEIKKKRSHWPGGQSDPSQIPRLYNCYNLCPCARRAHVGKCGPRVRVQVLQYSGSGTSGMVVLRFTTLFARDRHWRNPRKKKIESAAIRKARVSVHWRA